MKTHKRILSVTIKRMIDNSPDTSWLGEYSSKCKSEFTIDRAHSEDCQRVSPRNAEAKDWLNRVENKLEAEIASHNSDFYEDGEEESLDSVRNCLDELDICDCGEHGDMQRNEYRYFNPYESWSKNDTEADKRAWARSQYDRMESLNKGHWCFIGIRAYASVCLSVCKDHSHLLTQEISSGGLWGIESDSDREYIESVEKEELTDLRSQLKALGFSSRAISIAFKNVERKED